MKKLRYFFIGVVGILLYTMIIGLAYRNIYNSQDQGKGRLGILAQPMKSLAEIPLLLKQLTAVPEFYVKNGTSRDGINFLKDVSGEYSQKLLTSYKEGVYGSVVELIDISTGKSIKKWTPDNLEIFNNALNQANP